MASTCFQAIDLPSADEWMQRLDGFKGKETLQTSKNVQTYLCSYGLESLPYFSNVLLSMFVRCQSVSDSQQIFNRMYQRDENSWTILIHGYVEDGDFEHAFMVFHEMQEGCVQPNMHTFAALLKASARLKDINKGRNIYSQLVEEGFENELFIGSALIDMYAKCNSLAEAEEVFYLLPERNVVSWTALMAGYAENGSTDGALKCLEQMEVEGICPNWVTFMYALKACTDTMSLHRAMDIHNRVLEAGYDRDLAVSNCLLNMYLKHGLLQEAYILFEKLPVRNVVLWTALILGYAEHGRGEDALQCFAKMKLEGVQPDSTAYVCGLKACSILGAIKDGRQLHEEIVAEGFECNLCVGSALIDMYAKSGLIIEARDIFEELQFHNTVSWNALMGGYVNCSNVGEALNCLQEMQIRGMPPDVVSWTAVISGYAEQGDNEVSELYDQMLEQGILPSMVTFASILKACGDAVALNKGKMVHAQIYKFTILPEKCEIILTTALVDMYSKCSSMVDAQRIFDAMLVKDCITWNALIVGYAHQGEMKLVIGLVGKMQMDGLPPDETVLISLLMVCSHSGLLDEGQKLLEIMCKQYGNAFTGKQLNCMVDLLSRAGHISEALEMIAKWSITADVVTWSIILSACQKIRDVKQGRQVFEYMMMFDKGHDGTYILMSNIYADAEEHGCDFICSWELGYGYRVGKNRTDIDVR